MRGSQAIRQRDENGDGAEIEIERSYFVLRMFKRGVLIKTRPRVIENTAKPGVIGHATEKYFF
jgi:hypothetical protein